MLPYGKIVESIFAIASDTVRMGRTKLVWRSIIQAAPYPPMNFF